MRRRAGRAAASFADLPHHAILDRGRLVGFWEYDPAGGAIVWTSFAPPEPALAEQVRAVERTIREELGDVRAFSLDSPKRRTPRLDFLRARAAG